MKGTQWKLKSAVLRCPTCKAYIVAEFAGSWRFRHPTKIEKAKAHIDSPASQVVLSRAYACEEQEPPPNAKDDSDG